MLNDKISQGIIELEKQHLDAIDIMLKLSIDRVNRDFDQFLSRAKEIYKDKNGRYPESEEEFYSVALIAVQIREEVIEQIRNDVDEIRNKVSSNYNILKTMNDEVTVYLNSAIKVKESQKKVKDFIEEKTRIDLNIEEELKQLENSIDKLIKGE
jgi:hypothetical protein